MIEILVQWIWAIYAFLLSLFSTKLTFPSTGISISKQGPVLGEGGFSTVYLGTDASTKQKYAVKKMFLQSSEAETTAQIEISCLKRFSHPNIIKLIDTLETSEPHRKTVYLLFPLCKRGSLRQKLNDILSENQSKLSLRDILRDFQMIVSAIQVMHEAKPESIVHRDIKPDNIFFEDNGNPVLADFGSACVARIPLNTRFDALAAIEDAERNVTCPYRPPELFDPKYGQGVVLDCRTDVWSIGCLLFAWRFGYSPFESEFSSRTGKILVVETTYLRVLGDIPKPFYVPDIIGGGISGGSKKSHLDDAEAADDKIILDMVQWICEKDYLKRPYTNEISMRLSRILAQQQQQQHQQRQSKNPQEYHDVEDEHDAYL